MSRLSVGYIVDHPRRDLPGAVQFARAMLDRGADVYLIPLYDQAVDVPLLPLDAIVVNFARPANLDLVQAYHAMGLPVFVLDTEGGNQTVAGSNTPERLAALLRDRGFSPLLSGYFFWGPALRETFVAGAGMLPERLHTTGCPRFDYASPRWRSALRNVDSGYVLVNANFALVNPRFTTSEAKERETMIRAGWQAAYVDRLMAELKQALAGFVATVRRLAEARPNTSFLVRPHPFEDRSVYDREFAGLGNVVVRGHGDVLSVLAGARCLLHLNCATAVEAIMLRCLPVALEFLNTPFLREHAPLPCHVSAPVADFEALLGVLDNLDPLSAGFDFDVRHRRHVHPWFYENDGRAADRMADVLFAQVTPRAQKTAPARSLFASRRSPRLAQVLQGIAANAVGSLAVSRARAAVSPKRREKRVDLAHLRSELSVISRLEGRDEPLLAHAAHPYTRFPLASIRCVARRARGGRDEHRPR